jgi:hypothetical protein
MEVVSIRELNMRDKLIKLIHNFKNAHRLNDEDVIVNFGAAMVILYLRDSCNDIDMCVSPLHYKAIKTAYEDDIRGGELCTVQTCIDIIDGKSVSKEYLEIQFQGHTFEVHSDDFNRRQYHQLQTVGLQVDSAFQILEDKQRLNRPKDADDISRLQKEVSRLRAELDEQKQCSVFKS